MRYGLPAAMIGAAFLFGCVGPRERAPEPVPTQPAPPPQPAPTPAPTPVPPAPGAAWADLPDTPGAWSYGDDFGSGSSARFVSEGQQIFTLACSPAPRRVRLERQGAAPGATGMTVQTSYGAQRLSASGTATAVVADVPVASLLLDQIAFSRGHWTVDVPGLPRLVLPAQAEVARVAEDCRG